jgi:hypothetical protein
VGIRCRRCDDRGAQVTKHRRASKLREADLDFLDGYLEAYSELLDGAWQAACEKRDRRM